MEEWFEITEILERTQGMKQAQQNEFFGAQKGAKHACHC